MSRAKVRAKEGSASWRKEKRKKRKHMQIKKKVTRQADRPRSLRPPIEIERHIFEIELRHDLSDAPRPLRPSLHRAQLVPQVADAVRADIKSAHARVGEVLRSLREDRRDIQVAHARVRQGFVAPVLTR